MGLSHAGSRRTSRQIGKQKCMGPEAGMAWCVLRSTEKASVARAKWEQIRLLDW